MTSYVFSNKVNPIIKYVYTFPTNKCFFYPFKNTNEAYTATLMSDLTSYMNTDIWGTLDTDIVRFVDNLQI